MRRRNFLGAVGALLGAPALVLAKGDATELKTAPSEPIKPIPEEDQVFQVEFDMVWPTDKSLACPSAWVKAHSVETKWTNKGIRISARLDESKNQHGNPLVNDKDVVEIWGMRVIAPFGVFTKVFDKIKLQRGDTFNVNYDFNFESCPKIDEAQERLRRLEQMKLDIIAQNPSGINCSKS